MNNPISWLQSRILELINRREYINPIFDKQNERPVEYRFVFEQISNYYPKNILDVGTGVTALPHLMANCGCKVTAIDNIADYWPKGMVNRHFWVIDDDIRQSKIKDKFEMVTCVSTLEHIDRYDDAVAEMTRLLTKGGHLVLTFPYNNKVGVDNVYKIKGSNVGDLPKYPTKAFDRSDLKRWETKNHSRVVKQEFWDFFDGEYWTVGKMILPPKQVDSKNRHQISCIVMEKE